MTLPACKVCGKATSSKGARYCDKCRPPSKYRNKPTVVDGNRFDSKKEAHRWNELKLAESVGMISNLQRQVRFPILVNGKKVCVYIADFVYHHVGHQIIEDAKGRRTDVYKLKKKLLKACYDIDVMET